MNFRLKFFPILLSIIFFFLSFFQVCITVCASDSSHGGGGSGSSSRPSGEEWFYSDGSLGSDKVPLVLGFLISEAKCLSDGNFSSFISNYFDMKEYMTSKYISISDEPDENGDYNMIFSEDLMKAFKQALIEYAEEVNGFTLYPTTNYNLVPASEFKSGYMYKTFRNLVLEGGCIVVNTGNYMFSNSDTLYVCDPFRQITKDSVSFVFGSFGSAGKIIIQGKFYGTNTWTNYSVQAKTFTTAYLDSDGVTQYKTFAKFSEGTDLINSPYSRPTSGLLDIRGGYPLGSASGWTFFSTDGRKLKVFNSLNALKNYTVGQRGVYFGSGFYDTPTEIKVSFDDLDKYMNKDYSKLFDELKDLIGKETDNEDSLTEVDLEKLVDKLLDGLNNSGSGDNNKPGTDDNDNTGFFEGMLDTLSDYLDSIVMYLQSILDDLDYIVMQYQEMTEEEAKNKTDSALNELEGTFSEVGDMMTKKFPFCIPWDLKQLYVTLNGGKDFNPEESVSLLSDDGHISVSDSPPYESTGEFISVIDYSSPPRSSPGESGIVTFAAHNGSGGGMSPVDAGVYPSESGAPVFHIPLVIKSAGINSALVIDMSPFDGVSKMSRTLFLLIFIYQLILLSVRITEFLEGFIG